MNHQEAVKLIPWYVNGTLEARERRIVRKHLEKCFQCKAQLEEWERIGAALGELEQEAPQPPPRLPRQLVEQIQSDDRKTGPKPLEKRAPRLWRHSEKLFKVAAAALLAVVAIHNLYLRQELNQLTQPQTLLPVQISSEIRGVTLVELPQQARWIHLQVEIPPLPLDRSYSELGWQIISSESDQVLFDDTARVAERLDLYLPASEMGTGIYTLVVTGIEQGEGQIHEVSKYTIDLQRK
ncbi:MAG: zf-HC2 domain-containing protein [Acidobacteriota bacterium]